MELFASDQGLPEAAAIDPSTEERVLQRAVAEGYLSAEDLQEQARELAEWGPRLSGVVRSGLLAVSAARRLLDEARLDDDRPATAGMVSRPAPGPSSQERYQIGDLIGQGGMGRVFKAYDTSLKRQVALKLLKSDDPDRLGRFLREAQAQARVDHENVCKIYEVGELEGRPYIAMQLIEGQPLFLTEGEVSRPSPMLGQMTVEQKARLLQQVADGIHAAHREGLIHRDIKPSNIMLEPTEGGDFKPYVLDFGLAREVASAGVTSLGLAAGTPNFMAPEQARGDAGALDRRTDVYGLGATLYALLAGRPPFDGPSSLDVLVKVTEQEAPPLDSVPADLATIVTKCLAKEPAQRYESARALAEDLGRYLDGEPIRGRKTSLAYRLRKKARKHRKLVAAGAAASVAFLVLAGWSIQAQLRAQQRARLAGVFGQEVKAIESRMRIAHLLPEHDITAEKAAIRERMAALESQMRNIGTVAEGPGRYALGRGHLALGDPEKAREHLERAWSGGYREREVAHALGQALGALYQKELEAAERISDKTRREERKLKIQAEYRDPALRYLEQSRGLEVESSDYVAALVAFYEKRYDGAIQKARAAVERSPWLYEARALEARAEAAIARLEVDHGRYDSGTKAIQRAEAAYRSAFAIGRSDPTIPEGLCRLRISVIKMRLYARGGDIEPQFRAALEACDQAIRIDPEIADAQVTKSNVLWRMAELEVSAGREPGDRLAQAIAAGREALRLRPDDAEAYYNLALAHSVGVDYDNARGLDPSANVKEAVRYLDESLRRDPNQPKVYNEQGSLYDSLATYQSRRGLDPAPIWRKAEAAVEKSLALKPDYELALRNVASIRLSQVPHELDHGRDPRSALVKGLEAAQATLAVSPDSHSNRGLLARVYEAQAERALVLGEDAQESADRAISAFHKALAINPKYRGGLLGMAHVQWLLGRQALERGRSPRPMIEAGMKWTQQVRESSPDNPPHVIEARLALLEGRSRIRESLPPEDPLARSQQELERALTIDAGNPDAHADLAEIEWLRVRWRRQRGQSTAQQVARGLGAVERALAVNSTHARALALRGVLYLEQARLQGADRASLRARARESLDQALAVDRFLPREYGPALEEARRSLRSAGPLSTLNHGGAQ